MVLINIVWDNKSGTTCCLKNYLIILIYFIFMSILLSILLSMIAIHGMIVIHGILLHYYLS